MAPHRPAKNSPKMTVEEATPQSEGTLRSHRRDAGAAGTAAAKFEAFIQRRLLLREEHSASDRHVHFQNCRKLCLENSNSAATRRPPLDVRGAATAAHSP